MENFQEFSLNFNDFFYQFQQKLIKLIIQQIKAINQQMEAINIYARDNDVLNEREYTPLIHKIREYFEFFEKVDPPLLKEMLYKSLFSNLQNNKIEILFCAQNLDSDLLLACARRVNQFSKTKTNRLLFLCDVNMLKDLIEFKVQIDSVFNLGIMHHYIPIDLHAVLDSSQQMITHYDPQIKQAVIDVIRYIPLFIQHCLSENTNVKVVLRSCYGVELPEEKEIPTLKETRAYPILIKLLNSSSPTESELNENIILQQISTENGVETILYLPIEGAEPIRLNHGLMLDSPTTFTQMAQDLINKWSSLTRNIPHINPFSIKMNYSSDINFFSNKKLLDKGLNCFKKVFVDALEEWDVNQVALQSSKEKFNSLFTTTVTLKNITAMPQNSYARRLLDLIKDYGCVSNFKAYYADYRAGPERTILAMDRDGSNASCPKAVEVSRQASWGIQP